MPPLTQAGLQGDGMDSHYGMDPTMYMGWISPMGWISLVGWIIDGSVAIRIIL